MWTRIVHMQVCRPTSLPPYLRDGIAGSFNPRGDTTQLATRSPHAIGVDPISRVGSYPSEMIVRLGLIEIAWIKAKAVSRPQFPVVDVTYMETTARTTARDAVVMAHMGDRRRQQFGGSGRHRRSGHASRGHNDCYHYRCRHPRSPSVARPATQQHVGAKAKPKTFHLT